MAWRSAGSLSRSLLSTARASSVRSSPTLLRLRPSPSLSPSPFTSSPRNRTFSFTDPRTMGELGCTQSLLPLHNTDAASRLTSYLSLNSRAFTELSQGTFCRTCQDR